MFETPTNPHRFGSNSAFGLQTNAGVGQDSLAASSRIWISLDAKMPDVTLVRSHPELAKPRIPWREPVNVLTDHSYFSGEENFACEALGRSRADRTVGNKNRPKFRFWERPSDWTRNEGT